MRRRVDEIVREIRREIEEEERRNPRPPGLDAGRFVSLRVSEPLRELNRRWPVDPVGEIRSHRRFVGPLIVAVKRLIRPLVLGLLAPYLERERELLREMVRFSNEVATRCDDLGVEIEEQGKDLRSRLDALEAAVGRKTPEEGEGGEG